jgi:transcription elongation factor SPT4
MSNSPDNLFDEEEEKIDEQEGEEGENEDQEKDKDDSEGEVEGEEGDNDEEEGREEEEEGAEDVEDGDEEVAFDMAELPDELKALRACLGCGLVKTFRQFYENGCDNCEFLGLAENTRRCQECTTSYFEGSVAVLEPQGSWVAKWQRISTFLPGMYAVQVMGELSEEDKDQCRAEGFPFRQMQTQ